MNYTTIVKLKRINSLGKVLKTNKQISKHQTCKGSNLNMCTWFWFGKLVLRFGTQMVLIHRLNNF